MATLSELFTNIANAIRVKTGKTDPIVANDFPDAIREIAGGYKVKTGTINSMAVTSQNNGYWSLQLEPNSIVHAIAISFNSAVNTNSFETGLIAVNVNNLSLGTVLQHYPCSFVSETMGKGFIYYSDFEGYGVGIFFAGGYLWVTPQCGWLDGNYTYTVVYE